MKRLLLILLLPACVAASPAAPGPYCKRQSFDAGFPPGLVGKYEIVGREPGTGRAYTGALEIAELESAYVLTRTIDGKTSGGEAWVEACGPDEFRVLRARYETRPEATQLVCHLQFDGDNYARASCATLEGAGLEAWYQRHEPSAPRPGQAVR